MESVLLDTSFCIRLIKKDDPYHLNAIEYFQYFLENKIELFLSTIVVSEYSVKDDINNLPLKTMKIIPFDFFDGRIAGEFWALLLDQKQPIQDKERKIVVKDDCKLIAQLYNRKIDSYITKDRKSFSQIIQPITSNKNFKIEIMDIAISLKDYRNELF
ncbi:MAG: hypothetical protein HW421_2136 [Ignavibacteria bacterium]|nr:hypothetical protein [Ignavibacteria bacterium]